MQGRSQHRDGTPYHVNFIDGVWRRLERLNCSRALNEAIVYRHAGKQLEASLFFGTVVTATGRIRGAATFTQRKNTPFQGLAADGAKIAIWELYKAGYRVVPFVHDEFVIELPEGADYTLEARRINRICCRSMERVTGDVPIACEYAVTRRWSKDAEAVFDAHGRLVPWEPNSPGSWFGGSSQQCGGRYCPHSPNHPPPGSPGHEHLRENTVDADEKRPNSLPAHQSARKIRSAGHRGVGSTTKVDYDQQRRP